MVDASDEARPPAFLTANQSSARYACAREMAETRALRWGLFGEDGPSDVEWDMLLALYLADERREVLGATDLIGAVEVPPSTGLRWIAHLVQKGRAVATPGGAALSMSSIRLSTGAREILDSYFNMIVAKKSA